MTAAAAALAAALAAAAVLYLLNHAPSEARQHSVTRVLQSSAC
jgi:hypothetical protein